MNQYRICLLILIVVLLSYCENSVAFASQRQNLPYFRVKYELPKIPQGISSIANAQKNLAIYKQHIQKNKSMMAETMRQKELREQVAKQNYEIATNLLKDDRRESLRFKPNKLTKPLSVTVNNIRMNRIVDISEGGIGLYSSVLKVNDEIPVKIQYDKTQVLTTLKIVSSSKGRVGGKFISNNEETSNQLVYLSALLENDSNMLVTKFSEN